MPRSQRTLERELRAEQNRSNRMRLSSMGPSAQRATGLVRYASMNSRAPLGTPSGYVLARQTGRPGSRSHGSRHLNRLRRLNQTLNQRQTVRNRHLAESRMANAYNNVSDPVIAIPFNEVVDLQAEAGFRPKREQLNQLPLAMPVRSFDSVFPERVKDEAPETNLYFPWRLHGPELQDRRRRSRSRTRREKGRQRSRSAPRRPRSHSR